MDFVQTQIFPLICLKQGAECVATGCVLKQGAECVATGCVLKQGAECVATGCVLLLVQN